MNPVVVLLYLALGLGFHAEAARAEPTLPGAATPAAPGAELFTNPVLPRLRITIGPEDMARLRRDGRQNVPALVQEGPVSFERVAIHLKGARGSFRSLDEKPALTLNFTKFTAGQHFHGLSKIHLNNSVEDPSYFHELAGSALFRAGGVPAPRVTHALVELNGRRLGLYVLKEGFTREFLGLYFRHTSGNLYETGAGHDVDEALKKNQGDGPDDRSDLQALAAAVREPDPARRWQALGRTLELERFLSLMALEVMACHRDGYCLARNNFRVYDDPDTGKLVFLPHGMDQLFGRPEATIRPVMSGVVARAVLETPEGRRQFRAQLALLLTNAFDVPALHAQAEAFLKRARPVLEDREHGALESAIADVKARIAQRQQSLRQQLAEPEPTALHFENGLARLTGWQAVDIPVGGVVDRTAAPDGRPALHIRAGPVTSASWRTKVLLPPGRYRFVAVVRTQGILGLDFGNNQGAGLRVVGGSPAPAYEGLGDHPSIRLERAFATAMEQEVELICELRARAGEVWFELDSLRLAQDQ